MLQDLHRSTQEVVVRIVDWTKKNVSLLVAHHHYGSHILCRH